MRMETYVPGQFCWVDLMAKDMEAAKAFYGGLFGWEASTQDTQGGPPYVEFQLDGASVAGMGQMPEEMKATGMPALWNSYIRVDDVEETARKVTAAGGQVTLPPMKVMDAGSMAMFADPTGAHFAVWQPGTHIGASEVNDPNRWGWNELYTRDVPAAQRFYTEVFGWTFEDGASAGPVALIKNAGRDNGTTFDMAQLPPEVPPFWMTYFTTDDLDAHIGRVESLGGTKTMGPMDIEPGRFAVFADPQGAAFVLFQTRPATAQT